MAMTRNSSRGGPLQSIRKPAPHAMCRVWRAALLVGQPASPSTLTNCRIAHFVALTNRMIRGSDPARISDVIRRKVGRVLPVATFRKGGTLLAAGIHGVPVRVGEIAYLWIGSHDTRGGWIPRPSDEALDLLIQWRTSIWPKRSTAGLPAPEGVRGNAALNRVRRLSTYPFRVVGIDDMARGTRRETARHDHGLT